MTDSNDDRLSQLPTVFPSGTSSPSNPILSKLHLSELTESLCESNRMESDVDPLCIVDWFDLLDDTKDLSSIIETAYGSRFNDSIGVLAVRNVPGFLTAKSSFLPMGHLLAAHLSEEYREEHLTDVASLYNAGWSFGKEKLGTNKSPDTLKGSYYYNPVTDTPGTVEERLHYPASYPTNIWPQENVIPGFREKAICIGLILKNVAIQVSKRIDQYVTAVVNDSSRTSITNYPKDFLHSHLADTEKVKARLLYYYPISENQEQNEDSWIGWHSDSGFLTALAGDIYVDHDTGNEISKDAIDPESGLYVMTRRSNTMLKVTIPNDCCAVQIGECTQIVTGGIVVATPHCVRGGSSIVKKCINNNNNLTPAIISDSVEVCTNNNAQYKNSTLRIARISLPCFVDTAPYFPLNIPTGSTREQIIHASCSSKVPPLELRWTTTGMTFGEFLQKTFSVYYDWSNDKEAREKQDVGSGDITNKQQNKTS